MKKPNKELIVILDNIRSAFNVGSIFRTSDAVGVKKLILCGMTAIPENPKVKKTALGADLAVPWEFENSAYDAINECKNKGYKIYGVEVAKDAIDFRKVDYAEKSAIVLGHERMGLSEKILQLCDEIIFVPMNGVKESLNVGVCMGIVAYEIVGKNTK